MHPVYTEYNIGHYRRSFNLAPNSFDNHKISAEMATGVLTLTLPKAERVKPRKIPLK
jgi:HSP20 family protein